MDSKAPWRGDAAPENLLPSPSPLQCWLCSPTAGEEGWEGVPVIAAVSSNNRGTAVINGSSLTFTYRFPSRDATSRARKNLHRREVIAPSSSVEGDLWLVLAIK